MLSVGMTDWEVVTIMNDQYNYQTW